jgi:hypothetical protein
MNKLIELGRSSIGLIEFNYRKIASLASNGMPLKKAFQKVYPGQEVPSASTIRKRMQSESGSSAKKRDFRRESYLRPSKPSMFDSDIDVIEFANLSPRRAHNKKMREKHGADWYKGAAGKKRRFQKPPSTKKASVKKGRAKRPAPSPSIMSKVGKAVKGRYGYGTIGGIGGLAIGGVLGRMGRNKEE